MKRSPLKRTTPLRSTSTLKRTPMKKKARRDPIPAGTTTAIKARSGGTCEARCSKDCVGTGQHRHHRQLRRFGNHSPENLLCVCHVCHAVIHGNPERSYALGLLVRGEDDPAAVPVVCLHP